VLVPINRRYPINELIDACNRYLEGLSDKRVVTIEYTMMAGVNDQPHQARELVKVLRRLPCKLNLIPFNPFPNSGYERPSDAAIQAFKQIMVTSNIITTVRRTRGDEIDAACGQLVGQVQDRTRRSQKIIPVVQEEAGQSTDRRA
jgi:23S rRNA (adenine2503-C2)-methyltransferase